MSNPTAALKAVSALAEMLAEPDLWPAEERTLRAALAIANKKSKR